MNKYLKLLSIFLFLLSVETKAAPNIAAKTAILIDYHTNKILFEIEPDMSIYPASMTKIMTSIIAFDLLKNGKRYLVYLPR